MNTPPVMNFFLFSKVTTFLAQIRQYKSRSHAFQIKNRPRASAKKSMSKIDTCHAHRKSGALRAHLL